MGRIETGTCEVCDAAQTKETPERFTSLTISRRQLLGSAATGAAALGLPALPAWAVAPERTVDVLLVGGGIMSATLGVLFGELEPSWTMEMVERLDEVALESSNGWNNAGTVHSALAELNYTPQDVNGNVQIDRAVTINESFQVTRQFLAHQVDAGILKDPRSFINSTPHMSFVWGDGNTDFLEKRFEALKASPLFSGMTFSRDHDEIATWVPIMMEGRDRAQPLAATWSPLGTDVNFGEITRQYVAALKRRPTFRLNVSSEVRDIARNADGTWRVGLADTKDGTDRGAVNARFVFLGAGGAALPLLQMAGIPEGGDYLAGQLLISDEDRLAALRDYLPEARPENWRLWQAGQRVQIIKRDAEKGGVLKLGTEIVAAEDGSIAALLGASPGASTAAPIMLDVLKKVFAEKLATPEWQAGIRRIVPSYGTKLNDDPQALAAVWAMTAEKLQLAIAAPTVNAPALADPGAAAPADVRRVPDMAL